MQNETIAITNTDSGKTMDVVVLSKRADKITVVIGEGVHSMQCELTPTRSGQAFVGSVLGREMVYQKSPQEIQAELDDANPRLKEKRRF